MKQLNNKVIKVLKYFSFFAYYPTLEEIYTFLQAKITKNELKRELKRLKYTPVEYSMLSQNSKVKSQKLKSKVKNNNETIKQWNNLTKKQQISKNKLNSIRFKLYIKLISFFPQIRLIGLSGSISMMNAGEDDDIDLFIITAKNRLFTGRLITLVLAQIFGLRRNREARSQNFLAQVGTLPVGNGVSQVAKNFNSSLLPNNETMKQWNNHSRNKVCLNLFFDENNLKVPHFKQTLFVGHEVLQMKPIIIKEDIYKRFLEANEWVFRLFPNARQVFSMKYEVSSIKKILNTKYLILDTINDWLESKLKSFQMKSINKHKTTEIITKTQLWFHPDDFEKKITEFL